MKKYLYFLLACCSGLLQLRATHNRAGEILYKRIAPFTTTVGSAVVQVYTYSITVIKYTEHGVGIADRCVDTVYFGDGSTGIAPRVNGTTGCCGSLNGNAIACGEIILSDPGYVVKKNIYTLVHSYSGPGSYLISSRDPNRNAGIVNIPNSDSQAFCVSSLLVISSIPGANSSPVLTMPPVDQGSLNACFQHNPGAVDADGDSLSYEMVNCECASTYSLPASGASGSFSIHPTTGTLQWCVPQQLGEYQVAFRINEWRKNSSGIYEKIGYVTRDMQILVKEVYQGIAEQAGAGNIQMGPNPCFDVLVIRNQSNVAFKEVRIYEISGRLVKTMALNPEGTTSLNISELQAGVYLAELQGEGHREQRRLLKN